METAEMVEMLSSLDMERGVGGRVGEGEVAALENWESRNRVLPLLTAPEVTL